MQVVDADLEAVLKRAYDTIRIVFQPVVSMKGRTAIGYEALMRSPMSPLLDQCQFRSRYAVKLAQ